MATFTGTQSEFFDALKNLVELDYDAVEAYEAAINRLENQKYKNQLLEFKKDHERHIKEVSDLLQKHNEEAPTGPSIGKQWLTKGKVVLAEIAGDNAILKAMLSNEEDTNLAYKRLNERVDKWEDSVQILEKGLEDEIRHKKWLESQTEK